MYICICNAVTDKDIQKAVKNGACSINDLGKELKVGTCCGRCKSCAKRVIDECTATNIEFPALNTLLATA
ncbi:MAG: hypothetical protein HN639_03780 [Candidatus Thioglobus sp.]|jgi:bacterioferritin-associated ferredoxin|nr:MAG: hypothetical protein Sup05_1157 [uncultured Candidatus Thioglobus sp.]MBT7498655.1 hypothetical protein [Candidatus Thioglobus sp.]